MQSRSPKNSQHGVDVDIFKGHKTLSGEMPSWTKFCPGKFSQEAIVKHPHSSELNLKKKNVPTKAQWEFYVRKRIDLGLVYF